VGRHRGLVAFVPCCLLLGALSASADTITASTTGYGINVTYSVAGTSDSGGGFAGQVGLTDTNASGTSPKFNGYCVDIYHSFNLGAVWTATPSLSFAPDSSNKILANANITQELAYLYNTYSGLTNTGSNTYSANDLSAALQFALWGAEYSTSGYTVTTSGSTFVSATAGVVTLSQYSGDNTDVATAIGLANLYIAALPATITGQSATFYLSAHTAPSQDMIGPNVPGFTPAIVPEPSSFLLLTAGLGAVALGARKARRARKAG
jgi:hypothetical protein